MKLLWKAFLSALKDFYEDYDWLCIAIIIVFITVMPFAAICYTWARVVCIIICLNSIIGFIIWIYNYFSSRMRNYIERQKRYK